MFAHNSTARVYNIGKHAGRTEKNIILTSNARVKRYIILHLYIITQHNSFCYEYVLTNVTILSNSAATHNVREMPDARALAYYSALINYTCRMCKICCTHSHSL